MTTTSSLKTVVVFLIFSIVLALASNAFAARKLPGDKNNKKKPDCIDPDGSVLFPGLGRILVPTIPGIVSYNPPSLGNSGSYPGGDSGSFPGGDGDVPSSDGGDSGSFPGGDGDVPSSDANRN